MECSQVFIFKHDENAGTEKNIVHTVYFVSTTYRIWFIFVSSVIFLYTKCYINKYMNILDMKIKEAKEKKNGYSKNTNGHTEIYPSVF